MFFGTYLFKLSILSFYLSFHMHADKIYIQLIHENVYDASWLEPSCISMYLRQGLKQEHRFLYNA